jgi:hypothetical protein
MKCFRKVQKARPHILERRTKLVLRSFPRKQKVNKLWRQCVRDKSKLAEKKTRRESKHIAHRLERWCATLHVQAHTHLSHNVRGHYSLREHTQINLHYRRIFQEISLAAWLKEIVDRIRSDAFCAPRGKCVPKESDRRQFVAHISKATPLYGSISV